MLWCWKACWLFWPSALPVQPLLLTVPPLLVPRSRSSAAALLVSLRCSACPFYVATVFMTMCVSALALTSLDAVARIGRMSFQELFSVDDMEHAEGWRKLFCNTYFSTIITLHSASC